MKSSEELLIDAYCARDSRAYITLINRIRLLENFKEDMYNIYDNDAEARDACFYYDETVANLKKEYK